MNAAIYARKSTEQHGVSDDQKSVARQVEHARAYATAKGWTVDDAHIYIDDGISGAEFANRPGFLRLMNALKPRPPFHALVMSEGSRLGREMIETAYALKQLDQAGVEVWLYLEDRRRTLTGATEKLMMSVSEFASEIEREKASQRVTDAMHRKARAGHVTGGRVFGYDNVEILGEGEGRQRRQRVERRINPAEAAIVARIFELCSSGTGYTRIAKLLNAESAVCPRPQRQRPAGWSPSSVNEILHRPLYRGLIVWNKTKKRDQWGQHKVRPRPEADWMHVPAPELRIVSDDLWNAAHRRLDGIRAHLISVSKGTIGRRSRDADSRYLLPGFARCGICGGGLCADSRTNGNGRAWYYACLAHHKRGSKVCTNGRRVRMERVDAAVLDVLGGDVLKPEIVEAVIAGVFEALRRPAESLGHDDRVRLIEELQAVTQQGERLTEAIAQGGQLSTLLEALQARQARARDLRGRLEHHAPPTSMVNRKEIERDVRARLADWRGLLTRNVQDGRELLRRALVGPMRFTPDGTGFRFEGEAAIGRLFEGVVGGATLLASLSAPSWNQLFPFLDEMAKLQRFTEKVT